ncbi:hypothetical protein CHS0354_010971, partial [Potamilus streckersoni]
PILELSQSVSKSSDKPTVSSYDKGVDEFIQTRIENFSKPMNYIWPVRNDMFLR